jgi:hypothetical protein
MVGSTFFNIGASEGIGVLATAIGKVPPTGAGDAAGAALAGCSSSKFNDVAAKPPNAAAAVRASKVLVAVFIERLRANVRVSGQVLPSLAANHAIAAEARANGLIDCAAQQGFRIQIHGGCIAVVVKPASLADVSLRGKIARRAR